jgi:hypothetical protein
LMVCEIASAIALMAAYALNKTVREISFKALELGSKT